MPIYVYGSIVISLIVALIQLKKEDKPKNVWQKTKPWIIGLLLILGALLQIYSSLNTKKTIQDQMSFIGSTGWVFLGYYDFGVNKFTEGPFFSTFSTAYKIVIDSLNLHKGDVLILLKDRNVIIEGFKINRQRDLLNAPLANLTNDDYTGVIIPMGTKVRVEDLSITNFPNDPYAVWVRIRLE